MSTSQEEGGTLNWSCWCLGRALREQGKSKREKTPLRETEDEDLTGGDDQRGLERGRDRRAQGTTGRGPDWRRRSAGTRARTRPESLGDDWTRTGSRETISGDSSEDEAGSLGDDRTRT